MTLPLSGTADVLNGNDLVAWTGTALTDLNCTEGATVALDGAVYFIKARTDTDAFQLTRNYAGADGTVAAEIEQLSPNQVATATLNSRVAALIAALDLIDPNYDAQVPTLADLTPYADKPGPTGDKRGFAVLVNDIADGRAGIVSKESNASGDWGDPAPYSGPQGEKGWSPQLVTVADGTRRVFKLAAYVGGAGDAPTSHLGEYLKGDGTWTATIGDAIDMRGPGGTGTVAELIEGDGISIDSADPTAPIISSAIDVLTFYAVTNLETAKRTPGDPIFTGPDGNGIFDGFGTLTYIDVSGATDLDTSEAGVLKPTKETVINDSDGPFGSATDFTAFTMGDMSWKLNNGQVCTKIGFQGRTGTQTVQLMILKRNSAGNFDVVVSESHTYTLAADGWTDRTLTTPYSVPAAGDYYVAVKTSTMASNVWTGTADRFHFSGTAAGSGVTFTEDTGSRLGTRATQISGDNDVVVSSEPIAVAAPPAWARVFAFADLETAVLNTDFILSVTRDGAEYQALTMVEKYARPDGTKLYVSGEVDITGIASGTSCKWKWVTANGKAPELHGVGLLLGV